MLKEELHQKERVMAEMAVDLAIFRKRNEWGFLRKIEAAWMGEERKSAILLRITEARAKGAFRISSCAMWMIDLGRVVRDGLGSGSGVRVLLMASPAPRALYTRFSRRNAQP